VIKGLNMENQIYVISFDHRSLQTLRGISHEIKIGPLVNRILPTHYRLLKKLNADYFAVKYSSVKKKHIRKCEELGVQLVVWTVNTIEQMRTIKQYPTILVTTDELEKYKAVLS